MFCKYCGSKVEENHKFCCSCGNSINFKDIHELTQNINCTLNDEDIQLIRQREIEKINNIISYFSVNQGIYDEYESSAKSINELNRINAKMALIWSIILFAISFAGLLNSMSYSSYYNVGYYLTQFLICAPISGGLLIMFFSLNRRRRARLEGAISKYCYDLTYLSNYYRDFKDCPIGIEYSNPSNLKTIKSVIESGRTNSIKEALNMLTMLSQQHIRKDFPYVAAEYLMSKSIIHPGTASIRNGKFFDKI